MIKESASLLPNRNEVNKPLRIGVALDNRMLKRWESWCLRELCGRSDIAFVLALSNAVGSDSECGTPRTPSRMQELWRSVYEAPWILIDNLDRCFARRDYSRGVMDDVDLAEVSTNVPVIEIESGIDGDGNDQRSGEGDLCAVRNYDLDILICFGSSLIKGPFLSVVRHGVWFFQHSDSPVNRSIVASFWEIAGRTAVTGLTLRRLTAEAPGGQVLARGWYPTDLTSWNRNHQRIAERGWTLLIDAVDRVVRHGEPPRTSDGSTNIYCHPPYEKPGPATALATAVRTYARPFARKLNAALWHTQWHIRWGYADAAAFSVHRLNRIVPPPDRLWADPFPVTKDGRAWLFVEEMFYANARGRIVALEVDGDQVLDHRVVLDPPFHLSYPFLFEHEGELYMIPESNENHSVELWHCKQFPDQWERIHEILSDVRAVDTTLIQHDERYYLFTTLARNENVDRSTELHIYHADSPLSRSWTPHAANPVLVDCRAARMAGGFLTGADGSLIRCAQFRGARYGEAITLRRVELLTPDEYAEAPAGEIVPRWQPGLIGTHHLSARNGIVCVDACTSIPRWIRRARKHPVFPITG